MMGRMLVLCAAIALVGGACSVREDARPRVIPAEQRDDVNEIATGEEAEGASRIYLFSPVGTDEQIRLRSVPRNEAVSPTDLLASLLRGANEAEASAGLSTAIPADLEIRSARTVGTRLTIDINDAFNELSDDGLRQALAQLVATAGEIGQVQQVRLRVDGQNQGWPTGDGVVTDRPLSIYDYPGFLETSQPDFPSLPS
jgi:spore germination protein GerM